MPPAAFIVAGTDTGVGKTVFAAALTAALGASYWKPVQAGLEGEPDEETVRRLAVLAGDRIVPGIYRLTTPASPHIAAAIDGVDIRLRQLVLPATERALVVETAGGLMVPFSSRLLQIDVLGYWQRPVILCARTTLGTINHALLSLEALRRRRVPVHGVAFIGEPSPEVEAAICDMGGVRRLGRLGPVAPLDAVTLRSTFAAGFDVLDFGVG